jgi:hypothetical protein
MVAIPSEAPAPCPLCAETILTPVRIGRPTTTADDQGSAVLRLTFDTGPLLAHLRTAHHWSEGDLDATADALREVSDS